MATIELDDMELTEAVRGARCLRDMAQADADRQTNPGMRAIFERSIKYHDAMAEKFQRARKSSDTHQKLDRTPASR